MGKTSIEWTDMSWPVINGCRRISQGCGGAAGVGGCYAERLIATRLSKTPKYQDLAAFGEHGPRWTGESRLWLPSLDEPLRVREPSRIFVADMGDLFFEENSNEDIAAIYGIMLAATQHTFQVLTKRVARAVDWYRWATRDRPVGLLLHHAQRLCQHWCLRTNVDQHLSRPWPLPNVHFGASVEDQKRAEERGPLLGDVPAAVRFLSVEPLLGPVDLTRIIDGDFVIDAIHGTRRYCSDGPTNLGDWPRVDWVIVGGESGPGARVFDIAWARDIVQQCRQAKVPCFVKQFGDRPTEAGAPIKLRTRKGGNPAEWPGTLSDWPREFPEAL